MINHCNQCINFTLLRHFTQYLVLIGVSLSEVPKALRDFSKKSAIILSATSFPRASLGINWGACDGWSYKKGQRDNFGLRVRSKKMDKATAHPPHKPLHQNTNTKPKPRPIGIPKAPMNTVFRSHLCLTAAE